MSRSMTETDSGMDAIWSGEVEDEVPAFGGGEDGGVEVDRMRCRCTSPRNTLPICCDIARVARLASQRDNMFRSAVEGGDGELTSVAK